MCRNHDAAATVISTCWYILMVRAALARANGMATVFDRYH